MSDIEDTVFKWGDYTILPKDIPVESLHALAQRGVTHVLGNEVASALTAWRKTEEGKVADDAAIAAWLKARREAKIAQIMNGTLGVRASSGQSRVTGLNAVVRQVATEWLKASLAKQKIALPTGDKTVKVKGQDMTRDELVAKAVSMADKLAYKPGVTIRGEAEARFNAQTGVEESVDGMFDEDNDNA